MWIPFAASLLGVLIPAVVSNQALAPAPPDDSAVAPNILFILTDDQRVDTIGAWGQPGIATPNLDRIVAQGTSFRRNYCMGSSHGAVCAPSRAMIHSGRAYHRIDHRGLTGVPVLGEGLQELGYRTYGVGKWHNGQPSFKRSFHEGRAVMFGGMSNHFAVPLKDVAEDGTVTKRETVAEHSSDLFAEAAVEFVDGAPQDKPFFLSVAFTAPHDPRDPPAEWRTRERPALPANFADQHGFDNGFLTLRDEVLAAWPREPGTVRQQLAEYYGLIEHMDAAIGRVLDAMEARNDGRETVIVLAADHGLAVGSHGLLGKQSVYEHSLRAPLVIAGPGVPAGQHVTALTYLFDIYPTVLGLAGAKPSKVYPMAVLSRDLGPVWRGEVDEVRDAVYLSMGKTQRAVTDGRWKLCVYPAVNHAQLFDLASDPHEMVNLAGSPAFQPELKRMVKLLRRWHQRVGDPDPLVVEEHKPFHMELAGRKRKPDRWQPDWIREAYFDPPEEPVDAGEGAGEK